MRIVVFSDSHRNYAPLEQIVEAQPGADLFLHLGDGEAEFRALKARYPHRAMQGVCGNCDWGCQGEVLGMLTLEHKRIFYTHGHRYGVKAGLEPLLETARKLKAKVVLYGHTHVARAQYRDGIYLLNPGSVSFPKEGPPSYGFVDITPGGIFTSIVPL